MFLDEYMDHNIRIGSDRFMGRIVREKVATKKTLLCIGGCRCRQGENNAQPLMSIDSLKTLQIYPQAWSWENEGRIFRPRVPGPSIERDAWCRALRRALRVLSRRSESGMAVARPGLRGGSILFGPTPVTAIFTQFAVRWHQ